jgi:hypothetical protein
VDTEKERELAAIAGISAIPAFLLIPQEGGLQWIRGIAQTPEATKEMFVQVIDEFLLAETSDQL